VKALRFALVALSRDWRSGELAVLVAALLVAVAALTGVGFFTDRVGQAVTQQAAEVIAADLRLQASKPPAGDYIEEATRRGLATARTLSFPTVVFFGEESTLAAIRAVSPGYPLRGRVKVADAPFGEARETADIPARGEVWFDSRLLARLGANVGDSVNIGASSFRVTRVLAYRPDQGSAFVDLAASLLMNLEDMPATELIQPGSRATHAILGGLVGAGVVEAGASQLAWGTLAPLAVAVVAGAAVCELFSSGGFYFFSGRFAEPTLVEFGARLAKYFPSYLGSLVFYVAIAAIVHTLLALARGSGLARDVKAS